MVSMAGCRIVIDGKDSVVRQHSANGTVGLSVSTQNNSFLSP